MKKRTNRLSLFDSSKLSHKAPVPDQDARDRLVRELDQNFLVEAAAGSGKTTSLVERMTALLRHGRCDAASLAAMTFTKKAAAEMNERFQLQLRQAAQKAENPTEAARLKKAAHESERCFVGTIHAFCARLLRERPVEAGVAFPFVELEEKEDAEQRDRAWDELIAELHASNGALLEQLRELGLPPQELKNGFAQFAEFPDVEIWPGAAPRPPETELLLPPLRAYLLHMEALAERFPKQLSKDALQALYRRLPRLARALSLSVPRDLFRLLERFKPGRKLIQQDWPADGDRKAGEVAKAEAERWDAFCREHAEPALAAWRAWRYGAVLKVYELARRRCAELRRQRGQLNFQDLLLLAAKLLRTHPEVRSYFRKRWTHLLLDEFQDTDPLQAEVVFLLTAQDPNEPDWRKCRPHPGSLFVVGDPQQSIYRFRRADIRTYEKAKEALTATGGDVVVLSANFRATPKLVGWVNSCFEGIFPEAASEFAPAHRPMLPGRNVSPANPTFFRLELAKPHRSEAEMAKREADRIAAFIADELKREPDRLPSDYLILTLGKSRLGCFAAALERCGVPHQVTGGNQVGSLAALRDLLRLLEAATDPADGIALIAVARGAFFGFSDPMLFRFRDAGGRFRWTSTAPETLPKEEAAAWRRLFELLERWHLAFRRFPPLAALEVCVRDSSFTAQELLAGEPRLTVAGLEKMLALLRAKLPPLATPHELIDALADFCQADEKEETLTLPSEPRPAVRIMNLHKAKGLEARTVFLADPGRDRDRPVTVRIDRDGEHAIGYLAIHRAGGFGPGLALAHPMAWDRHIEEERRFQSAEEDRLRYVAATRAMDRLIVRQPVESETKSDFWTPLTRTLADAPALPALPIVPAEAPTGQLKPRPEAWRKETQKRFDALCVPSYGQWGMKEAALAGLPKLSATVEQGAEWGALLHHLFESLLKDPAADAGSLVEEALQEQELPTEWREDALEAVRSVAASPLWKRATASDELLVEVPLAVQQPESDPPAWMQGQIDLAFREREEWTLVDFKTDRQPPELTKTLAKRYAPQLQAYAKVWEQALGRQVKERLLFFTHTGQVERA